ncbi:hypothetical protein A3SI_10674 [Nitritalea halalkaliphila LW7]|uniref:Uncharacterized protein n=2 Tax=Nitritalea TaxID=1187887 RepID=I5C374_9BACT|nr:hypothetical protein A3SI_10674 [Nitritalea halalkaliphila LW7]
MGFSPRLEDIQIVPALRENTLFIDQHLQESVHLLRNQEGMQANEQSLYSETIPSLAKKVR